MQTFLRKFFQVLAATVGVVCALIMAIVIFYNTIMPSSFNVIEGDRLTFPNTAELTGSKAVDFNKTSLTNNVKGTSETIQLKLFNIIPIKNTHIKVIEKPILTPGGTPFGIKLFTQGVIVIDVNNVETGFGVACPGKLAGIIKGDILLSIDSIELSSNEQVAQIIENSQGRNLNVTLKRDGKTIKTILTPAISSIDDKYKSGLWVRDSSAGIGTVTYYMKDDKSFAGLGHGICDVDTGEIMPLSSGEVCEVSINSVLKGQAGTPGELRGSFISDRANGVLVLNNESGIFGRLNENPNNLPSVDLRLKQEVMKGPAKIICTTDSTGPQEYDINIEKIDLNPRTLTKNMVIEVTDERLLEKTGGIVQGMSGSPILQNGELVGAVTHVFINDPKKGYGIFAENMLNFTSKLANCG